MTERKRDVTKSVRGLAALALGAFALSAIYAVAFSGGGDDREGRVERERGDDREDRNDHIRQTVRGDAGDFSLRDDDLSLTAMWRGDYALDETGAGIASVEDELVIKLEDEAGTRKVVFAREGERTATSYYVDGEQAPAGPETDENVRKLLVRFFRASGLRADERIDALYAEGGARAVIDEISMLEGDHAIRRYATALAETKPLTAGETAALIETLSAIDSDHDLSLALEAALRNGEIDEAGIAALSSAAARIDGDYEKRRLVQALAEGGRAASLDAALAIFGEIASDHDLRIAAEELFDEKTLGPDRAGAVLEAAGAGIDSDHDLRRVLEAGGAMVGGPGALADAWFDAYAGLQSDHDRRLALAAIADAANGDAALARRYREAAGAIASDHDRGRALDLLGEASETGGD